MADSTGKTPWKNGYWINEKANVYIFIINGEKMDGKHLVALDYPDIQGGGWNCTIKFGDFGPARKEVADVVTGDTQYNIEIDFSGMFKSYGIVNETGTEITTWGITHSVETMKWLSPEDVEKRKEDRDDFNAPSCPHVTPQPEKQGKVFWLSGPPGAGKSTTCQLMARENGYVYYEADATSQFVNPFIDLNAENPSMATMGQKPVKGVPRDVAETVIQKMKKIEEAWKGGELDDLEEKCHPLWSIISHEVTKQKKRLGGDFAVAQAVISRKGRQLCREILGPDAVFIVMNLTKSCQKKRIEARHGSDSGIHQMLTRVFDIYEPAGEDEDGAYNVTITEDMTRQDVLKEVLGVIAKI